MIGELCEMSDKPMAFCLVLILSVATTAWTDVLSTTDAPSFGQPISNVTIPVGRDALLVCVVDNLATYKVAWLQVNTQTILTIATHVITKNHRISVSHSDHRWHLQIRDVRESDQGEYMCQINTDPMISQVGYLKVVVPPDILDYPTSTDIIEREGNNVTLRCAASGSPSPNITWKRETSGLIPLPTGEEVVSVNGTVLNITRVNRLHMGAYLCIASNGVPPTVSKRIMLIIQFPPMITISNQLVGAQEGKDVVLECHSEAYPKSINYWTNANNTILSNDDKYESSFSDNVHMDAYKVHMKLKIRRIKLSDYGTYKCISKNSLGSTDGTIKLYRVEPPTTRPTTTSTTPSTTTTTTPMPTVITVEKKPRSRFKSTSTESTNINEIINISNPSSNEKRGAKLREKQKYEDKHERNHNSIENIRSPDKTAQSMSSSKSSAIYLLSNYYLILFIIFINILVFLIDLSFN